MDGHIIPPLSDAVGVFPLPNAVLLPGGTLPLHIHEPRYQLLVNDAIENNALMAMAFLLPGYEPYYHTLVAKIHPIVCVGMIRECVRTSDGRFFLNLVGICRAKISEEDRSGDYRRAYLEPVQTQHSDMSKNAEFAATQLCRQLLHAPVFDDIAAVRELRKVCGNSMSLEQLVDLLAAAILPTEAVEIRQLILSEPSVFERTGVLLGELQILAESLRTRHYQLETTAPGSLMN